MSTLGHLRQILPLWIIFTEFMLIKLKEELLVGSDKTIDDWGALVRVADGCQVTRILRQVPGDKDLT